MHGLLTSELGHGPRWLPDPFPFLVRTVLFDFIMQRLHRPIWRRPAGRTTRKNARASARSFRS